MARLGTARRGLDGIGSLGLYGIGQARFAREWQSWLGSVRKRLVPEWYGSHGSLALGMDGIRAVRQSWIVSVRSRQDGLGSER